MKLWRVTIAPAAVPVLERAIYKDVRGRPSLNLLNYGDFVDNFARIEREFAEHDTWERGLLRFKTEPTNILLIDEPTFDLDYFSVRNEYASAKLRRVLALSQDEIAYRAIDCSRCTAAISGLDYNAFIPLKLANPFDPLRMAGHVRPVRQEDGSMQEEWRVEQPSDPLNPPVTVIYFQPDFRPPAPLFRVKDMPWCSVVTEELADRVTRAGITGIVFQEIEGERAARQAIYRSS